MSKKPGTAGDPVEAADAEVLRRRDREIEIWRDRRQRTAELLDLEATTGRDVAEGGSVADAGRLLAEGRAGLDVLDRAADEVARQREAAVPLIWRAQAATKHASEAAKRTEAQERGVRTKQLLAELKEHERCEYGPAGPQPGQGFVVNAGEVVVYQRPHTERLLAEADDEGRAAGTLERQELNLRAGGQVSATSIEGLLAAGLGDGRHVFPPLRDVERWALDAELAGRKRLQRTREGYPEGMPDPNTAPATWTLTWLGREIVVSESRVSFLGLSGSGPADDYFGTAAGLEQVGVRSWTRPDKAVDVDPGPEPIGWNRDVPSGALR
jgi:hypothetical protein